VKRLTYSPIAAQRLSRFIIPMKPNLKTSSAALALGLLLALPLAGRAGTIYSDSFESDAEYYPPAGFTVSSDTAGNSTTDNVAQPASYYGGDFDEITGQDGAQYVLLHMQGPVSAGTGTGPALETLTFTNTGVGADFLANTTYTLTYLTAGTEEGTTTTSLLANGAVIPASSQVDLPQNTTDTFSSNSITFDTATDPGVNGEAISFQTVWSDDLSYDREIGVDDYVLSATSDFSLTPEPSTWALMLAGFAVLTGWKLRRSSARS
jgi:hypothetical protein